MARHQLRRAAVPRHLRRRGRTAKGYEAQNDNRKGTRRIVNLLYVPRHPAVLGEMTKLVLENGDFPPPHYIVGDPDDLIALDAERPSKTVGIATECAPQLLAWTVVYHDSTGLDCCN